MKLKHFFSIILLLMVAAFLHSCGKNQSMNKRITLWRNDRIRYGTYVAHEWMKQLFPDAQVSNVTKAPGVYADFTEEPESWTNMGADPFKKLRVIISPKVLPDSREWNRMLAQLGEGAEIFISTTRITREMADSMAIELRYSTINFEETEDSLVASVYDPVTWEEHTYAYPGFDRSMYISSYDSLYTTILGTNAFGQPNFVRFDYKGGGSLYLHTAPLAFSNFFLLHKNNHEYFEKTFSWIGKSKTVVEWDDYFRNRKEDGNQFSRLQVILKEPALRSAFWVVLLIFGLIYLFETKRKQSALPAVPKIKNSARDFVETVSALYYQRRDNKNLGEKMIHQFAEHLQRKYFLRFAPGDKNFLIALAGKTGMGQTYLEGMCYKMQMLKDYPEVSDELLLEVAADLNNFYKKEQHG
ncbi:hypothetical protein [Parasegetibacter sp. NRK P23]|uniref:hypothetical protein n=1 Tax=Parasegetibacter sp. NRK P23 TaxID=2942999 RepID=UPI002042F9BC|nr:hypothetical protein [Parasegetibacter sp. NRK P23]MCM5526974.1 hypothetical protein [Parasegetibacter sp. NRK P23]